LVKSFGAFTALKSVSMQIEHGEFVAVLGPSGCGKTTMLRLVAGFDTVTAGNITIGETLVSGSGVHVPPEKRGMGIVFQSYALWPHMDVSENVAYALRVQGLSAVEREQRVATALATVGLSELRSRRPATLSGGQRQRVALARCLAAQPGIVLLDEPLANLDVHLRSSMEGEFAAFHKRSGTTMFYITHDQAEAMALADRIAVMDQGKILQMATPSKLYREPRNPVVARFIGAGMVLPARIEGDSFAGRIAVNVQGHRAVVRCQQEMTPAVQGNLCVRAGDMEIVPVYTGKKQSEPDGMKGTVHRGYFQAEVALAGDSHRMIQLHLHEPTQVKQGDMVHVRIKDGWLIPEDENTP
jgi:iron(III) transport system ATP-binding protein